MHGIMRAVLHVTNGDSALAALEAAGFENVIPWRDVLHEGPLPDYEPDRFRRSRARFLAEMGWAGEGAAARSMAERDAALAEADEITLWFESDLYDDLQRMQISAQLDGRPAKLVLIDEQPFRGVAQLSPGELRAAPANAVDAPDLRAEWDAVRADDPRGVTHQRYREQFPWTTDNLNRSERQLLEAVGAGATTREAAFMEAQKAEERPFLGDATAFAYLRRMAPLLNASMKLSKLGQAVLAGNAKWERSGYPLGGADTRRWRYDPESGEVIPTPAFGT
jgi:hypothetical protein